jgi:peptidoglycan/xylan/chitin deacetylase (PgdA/CDA1 family)
MTPWQAMPWPQRAKYASKLAITGLLHATGLLSWHLRRTLRGKTLVLMYHRVLTPEAAAACWSHRAIVVEQATFDRHMAAVRRHFDVLSLEDFERRLATPDADARPACLITFDDGWRDTYTHAWPVLRRHDIPAVVFLPVQFIGAGGRFWQEQMGALLHQIWERSRADAVFARAARPVLASIDATALLDTPPARAREAAMEVAQQRKRADPAGAAATLDRLIALVGQDQAPHDDGFMTWPEVREMAARGIAFGGHSVTHRIMTTLPAEDVRREAVGSRERIERELGPVTAFSYPNGDWNADVARIVGEAGYRVAFSTQPGPIGAAADRLALRRVNIHEDVTRAVPLFLARLGGVL